MSTDNFRGKKVNNSLEFTQYSNSVKFGDNPVLFIYLFHLYLSSDTKKNENKYTI